MDFTDHEIIAEKRCGEFIGHAFHLLRVRKKLTQVEVAKLLNEELGEKVTQSFVSKIENREKFVSPERFGRYCWVLGVRAETVMKWARQCALDDLKSDSEALVTVAKHGIRRSRSLATSAK